MRPNYQIKFSLILFLIFMLVGATFLHAGNITFKVRSSVFKIDQGPDGFDSIEMEGFYNTSSPGDPVLPYNIYNIALPPDVDWSSVKVTSVRISSEHLAGIYSIRPGAPDMTWNGSEYVYHWGHGKNIAGGKNINIYERNAFFPEKEASILTFSQMRKWKFTRIIYYPFLFNPVTGELTLIKEADITVKFLRSGEKPNRTDMSDMVLDGVAQALFLNFSSAVEWYGGGSITELNGTRYDYVIITTDAIVSNSTKLNAFVAHKQSYGYNVKVVTETDFGALTGQAPNQKAEKIRQWLINNYASMGIEYVLLIGNPSPYESGEGDIPMKMCYPRQYENDYPESPTDYFYADLTGNWNIDGDSYYGEFYDDYGVTGGLDLTAEVYVGRIPVYSGAYSTLDNILQKIIDYESQYNIAWRKSALLPMSYSTSDYDGASLAEQMMDDYLDSNGYSSWTQYQQGNGACALDSIYASNEELRGGTVVRDRWQNNDYGIVCWWGHGWYQSASVGCDGCWDGTLFSSSQTSVLDNGHPAFVYQNSCENGHPEDTNNLGYALLKKGAVGTVSASRVSWFNTGVGYGSFDGSTTNAGIGYEYVKRMVAENPAGESLYLAKGNMIPSSSSRLMNYFDFNLYGDPSTSTATQSIVHTVSAPSIPTGNSIGRINTYIQFTASGSACSRGHQIEYQYYWGNGSYSGWSTSTTRSYAWAAAGQYLIKVRARCSQDTSIVSGWSPEKLVSIGIGTTIYTLTIGTTAGGTTDPVPGTYSFYGGTPVEVKALPYSNNKFTYWAGVSAGQQYDNPIIMTFYENKTITATFSSSAWSTTQKLTWNSGESSYPCIALDANSNLHLVWQDNSSGNFEIYYKKSTDEGASWRSSSQADPAIDASWSAPSRITFNPGDSCNPKIAADSSNNLHLVWSDLSPGNWEIYYKKFTSATGTWSPLQRLTWGSGDSEMPAVAVDSSNNVYVLWQDNLPGNTEIYFKKSTNSGSSWSAPNRITWNSGISSRPAVAVDPSNKIIIVWDDTSLGNPEIHLKSSTNGGTSWSAIQRLTWNIGNSYVGDVQCDSNSEIHVFWNDNSPGNPEIYHCMSGNSGASWGSLDRLTWNNGNSYCPAAYVDRSNGLHVVWDDGSPGNQEIHYKRSVDIGQTWQALNRVTWTSTYSCNADVVVDSNFNVHIVWRDSNSGNQEIYYKKKT